MNDGVCICIECDESRIKRRIEHRYLDVQASSLEDAVRLATEARDARNPLRSACSATRPRWCRVPAMGAPIDIVTDQTSAHDPLMYLRIGVDFDIWVSFREKDPEDFTLRAREAMARHCEAMVGFQDAGAELFDYGNSLRAEARLGGYERRSTTRASYRHTSGRSSARARARSAGPRSPATRRTSRRPTGRSSSPSPTRAAVPVDREGRRARAPPRPAGAHLLARLRRARQGRPGFNDMVASVEVPRHWPSGETTSTAARSRRRTARPRRCSTGPTRSRTGRCSRDGERRLRVPRRSRSTTVATSASSLDPSGQVVVVDGTDLAAEGCAGVTNDPGMGVIGTSTPARCATEVAQDRHVPIPMPRPRLAKNRCPDSPDRAPEREGGGRAGGPRGTDSPGIVRPVVILRAPRDAKLGGSGAILGEWVNAQGDGRSRRRGKSSIGILCLVRDIRFSFVRREETGKKSWQHVLGCQWPRWPLSVR